MEVGLMKGLHSVPYSYQSLYVHVPRQYQREFDEITFCDKFVNLIKLDLSDCQIHTLPPANVLVKMVHLRVLYLHSNHLQGHLTSLHSLLTIPFLMHLTLYQNPVSLVPGY